MYLETKRFASKLCDGKQIRGQVKRHMQEIILFLMTIY